MSDTSRANERIGLRSRLLARRSRRRDAGMTLPEVTISVAITGIVVATMSMATTVILRQMDNTEGRSNNARSEQNVSLSMPADLSSAEIVDTAAASVPCGPTPACPVGLDLSGSNALMLTWTGSVFDSGANAVVPTKTVVSYRVKEVNGEFQMVRIECYSVNGGTASCESRVVLRDLEPPPAGTEWIPGVTSPSWIMTVSQAAAPDDTSGPGDTVPAADPGLRNKNAQRVVVTINGGGDVAGAGGGQNQISLSAGGTNREVNLTTDDLAGAPTFTAARTRCGGNFGVIVDKSGSIGSTNMGTVRTGVKQLIDTFAGTPVKMQVVTFSATADTLGAAPGWTKYYDMLNESDVTALKALVDTVSSNGGTNWEDGFFRMLRNSDGTVQAQLPNTILFFTDGVPTRSRLDYSSATAPATVDPLDGGLPGTDGSSFYQVGWNRTERLIRDRGSINIVGVYVNTNTNASSNWTVAGAGYHTDYERADAVVYEAGTVLYQRGNTVVYERGGHPYERNNNIVFQYANSGISWERYSGGSWVSARSGYAATSTQARDRYFSNNTSPGEADGWRARVSGSLGSWTTVSAYSDYTESNLVPASTDGFRSYAASMSSSWTSITQAEYDANNTTADATDGWRTGTFNTAPYDTWTSTTQALYEAGNSTSAETDGWRTRATATPTSWTNMTQAQYNASNVNSGESDGWRTTTTWATTPQATYESNNTNTGESDLWRTRVNGAISTWSLVTKAQYDASNTTSDTADGWRSTRVYSEPYTSYEASTNFPIKDYATIGNLVVNNTSGVESNFVEALPRGGPYTNAAAADLFVLPDYGNFGTALASVALDQCGGTVTLQTKVGSAAAQDPFTYENTTTHEVVQTSAAYRSGTFDIALPGGGATTVTISPQDFTNLVRYQPNGWTCKSAGVAYPFNVVPVAGHAPWTAIELTVNPNQAVSCVQQVILT